MKNDTTTKEERLSIFQTPDMQIWVKLFKWTAIIGITILTFQTIYIATYIYQVINS